jgi:hypothetical protein
MSEVQRGGNLKGLFFFVGCRVGDQLLRRWAAAPQKRAEAQAARLEARAQRRANIEAFLLAKLDWLRPLVDIPYREIFTPTPSAPASASTGEGEKFPSSDAPQK